jgi:hypothetical protein
MRSFCREEFVKDRSRYAAAWWFFLYGWSLIGGQLILFFNFAQAHIHHLLSSLCYIDYFWANLVLKKLDFGVDGARRVIVLRQFIEKSWVLEIHVNSTLVVHWSRVYTLPVSFLVSWCVDGAIKSIEDQKRLVRFSAWESECRHAVDITPYSHMFLCISFCTCLLRIGSTRN